MQVFENVGKPLGLQVFCFVFFVFATSLAKSFMFTCVQPFVGATCA